jgi:hypothetical protein
MPIISTNNFQRGEKRTIAYKWIEENEIYTQQHMIDVGALRHGE